MFIRESVLFKDLGEAGAAEVSKVMLEKSYEAGTVIYTERHRAEHLFILSEGSVQLSFGTGGSIDFTLNKRGEVFGWSSMVNREFYSVEAKCVTPTKVFKISREKLDALFDKTPKMGIIFYRNLAGAVVERLVDTYKSYLREGTLRGVTSFGSGRLSAEAEE
jgi:CRP-like cAMP-binding protein